MGLHSEVMGQAQSILVLQNGCMQVDEKERVESKGARMLTTSRTWLQLQTHEQASAHTEHPISDLNTTDGLDTNATAFAAV